MEFTSIDEIQIAILEQHYISERGLATSLTRGIQTIPPNIDNFLPVHILTCLKDLADRLSGLKQCSHGAMNYA